MNVEHLKNKDLDSLCTDNELVNFLTSYITLNKMSKNECIMSGDISVENTYNISLNNVKSSEKCKLSSFCVKYHFDNGNTVSVVSERHEYNKELISLNVKSTSMSLTNNMFNKFDIDKKMKDIFDEDSRTVKTTLYVDSIEYEVLEHEDVILEMMRSILSLLEECSIVVSKK